MRQLYWQTLCVAAPCGCHLPRSQPDSLVMAQVEPQKYVELLEKDVLRFGYSSREYVMLHAESQD